MTSKLESVLFVIFIFLIVWMTWVPVDYMVKNVKKHDFDFYRDIAFYFQTVKARFGRPLGKIATSYIAFYTLFCAYKFFFSGK